MKQYLTKIIENTYVERFIYALIITNVIAIIVESETGSTDFFYYFELISVIIFSIEYVIRVITGGWRYVISWFGLIDMLAILPFYIPRLIKMDFRVIRALRLIRLLRVFKLGRYSNSLKLLTKVVKRSRADISITLFVVFILLLISSTMMYYIESDAQPEKFGSILQSFWWAVATLTTVGYGDIYPITGLGKILSGFIAILGIGIIALPTGIISSSFMEVLREEKTCPHCGKKL